VTVGEPQSERHDAIRSQSQPRSRVSAKHIGVVIALVLILLGFATWRQFQLGKAAYQASTAALNMGDQRSAIAEARLAAVAIAPGSPYPSLGKTRIRAIANEARNRGDKALARSAWLALDESDQASRFNTVLTLSPEVVRELESLDGEKTWTSFPESEHVPTMFALVGLALAWLALAKVSVVRSALAVALVTLACAMNFLGSL
jgi:hypothetical protein